MSKRLDRSELEARRIEAGKLRACDRRNSTSAKGEPLTVVGGPCSLHGAARTGRPPLLYTNDQKRLLRR
jgi:hypothetical protein